MSENVQNHISRVHFKGYKSIQDLEIDFKPGLNIIIGPNGSGKTNFLEFLYKAKTMNDIDQSFYSLIEWIDKKGELTTFEYQNEDALDNDVRFIQSIRESSNGKIVFSSKWNVFHDSNIREAAIEQTGNRSQSKRYKTGGAELIQFGTPEQFDRALATPGQIRIDFKNGSMSSGFTSQTDASLMFGVFGQILASPHNSIEQFNYDELNDALRSTFLPVTEIKIDDKKVLSYPGQTTDSLVFENIVFLFKVYEKWLYWNQLSDGTKRLIYVISKLIYSKSKIILIEEPELGIHPDQLFKLMDFLKEQSKDKQIILTTHSPDVLDILEKDELDRIIVTRFDHEHGTKMHHLSQKQIKKAHFYMEESGSLSDFWVHSNLEEYEPAA